MTEEGHWSVEPKFNEDMYAFDPNDPVANPDWSPDLQVTHVVGLSSVAILARS